MIGYDVIYADPPWRYDYSKSKSRQIENQYQTLELADIQALSVPAAENSVLYCWATAPKLREALSVVQAWGFEYKTCMAWDKELLGMGYWFRGQHELLLVGTRGHFSPPPQALRVSSVLRHRREGHSKKPDIVAEWIEAWFPDSSKLELFARTPRPGWDVWGNEVESSVQITPSGGAAVSTPREARHDTPA